MTTLNLDLGENSYEITVGRGLLDNIGNYLNLNRRVVIVTDEGVPSQYAEKVLTASKIATVVTLPQGESTKSFKYFELLLTKMLEFGLTRTDAIVAVGGGVVGDLTGFAAASYMRGIDFYNIPTTLLAAVDSSVGGKCAINLGTTKNTVGAFYQPKGVVIDLDSLKTLDERQISQGLAESVKMALTSDEALFSFIESTELGDEALEKIVIDSLKIKIGVTSRDEKETGLRKILNFGHTLGHGIEAEMLSTLYHGECVALGMIPMASPELRPRITALLKKLGLQTKVDINIENALSHIVNDKKADGDEISAVFVDKIGSFRIQKMKIEAFCDYIRKNV